MTLDKVQSTFKDLLLDQPEALHTPPETLRTVLKTGDIPLHARLNVYRNNVVGSLSDNIVATFPTIEALVGKEFLESMARSFVMKNPPPRGYLNHYGRGFHQFIKTFEPAKNLLYLPDIARLDMAINDAYFAPDDTALNADDLARVPSESLEKIHLKSRQSTTLLNSRYPLLAIRDFCLSDHEDQTLDLDQGGVRLMVYRPHLDVEIVNLTPAEFDMLQYLQTRSLGDALSQTINRHPDFDVQCFLQKHITLETFQAF